MGTANLLHTLWRITASILKGLALVWFILEVQDGPAFSSQKATVKLNKFGVP